MRKINKKYDEDLLEISTNFNAERGVTYKNNKGINTMPMRAINHRNQFFYIQLPTVPDHSSESMAVKMTHNEQKAV